MQEQQSRLASNLDLAAVRGQQLQYNSQRYAKAYKNWQFASLMKGSTLEESLIPVAPLPSAPSTLTVAAMYSYIFTSLL